MPILLRVILIAGSIIFLIFLVFNIKKERLSNDIATFWIIFSLIIIFLALFPETIISLMHAIGIESSVNGVYLVFILLLLILSFILFVKISRLENKLNHLVQTIGIENNKNKQ